MKVDLVMWTKNGVETLPKVFTRIDEVIPKEVVCHKILVDDHSVDDTVKIAKEFNWQIYPNPKTGISSGANEALRHVDATYFISFEQDLFLSPEWFHKVPILLSLKDVVAASGMRFASCPKGVTALQKYVAKKYRGEKQLSSWLSSRKASSFTLGKTLDNTIYDTETLRSIGGFPKLTVNAGVDTILAYSYLKSGYHWTVDYAVQSVHLRSGLMDELKHQQSYGQQIATINRKINALGIKIPMNRFEILYRLFTSPFSGVFVALKTKEASVSYIHPLIRLYYTRGCLH